MRRLMKSIMYRGQSEKVTFVVTDTTNPPLLARNFLRKFRFELVQASQRVILIQSSGILSEQFKSDFSAVLNGESLA